MNARNGPVELATLLSVALRIEPQLIRRARLALAPSLDVGAEADLWFSPWVAVRSSSFIVLDTTERDRLRRQLAARLRDPRDPAHRLWSEVLDPMHAHLSPALRLQEELTWLALQAELRRDDLAAALRPALTAVVRDQREGVARWFARAWDHLPDEAKLTSACWQLAQVALPAVPAPPPEDLDLATVATIAAAVPVVTVRARVEDGALVIRPDGPDGPDHGVPVTVPRTDPLVVDLCRLDGERLEHQLLQVPTGAVRRVPVGAGTGVLLRSGNGSTYSLDSSGHQVSGPRVLLVTEPTSQDDEDDEQALRLCLLLRGRGIDAGVVPLGEPPDAPQPPADGPVGRLRTWADRQLGAADSLILTGPWDRWNDPRGRRELADLLRRRAPGDGPAVVALLLPHEPPSLVPPVLHDLGAATVTVPAFDAEGARRLEEGLSGLPRRTAPPTVAAPASTVLPTRPDEPLAWRRAHLFIGRQRAVDDIVTWLHHAPRKPRALLVTGAAGSGKSAVLGQVMRDVAAPRPGRPARRVAGRVWRDVRISCAVYARDLTAPELAQQIDDAAGAGPLSSLVVDALDEARADPADLVQQVLAPLLHRGDGHDVQVILAVRSPSDVAERLMAAGVTPKVIDLDTDPYFVWQHLRKHAELVLRRTRALGGGHAYHQHADAVQLARQIARLARPSFLVARLLAEGMAMHGGKATLPHHLAPDHAVDRALEVRLDAPGPMPGVSPTDLLSALALGDGPLPAPVWARLASALTGRSLTPDDVSRFADGPMASWLVEFTTATGEYRLADQPVREALIRARASRRPRAEDERLITDSLLALVGSRWGGAHQYVRRAIGGHADRAGMVDDLLRNDDALLNAHLPPVVLAAARAVTPKGRDRRLMIKATPAAEASAAERQAMFTVAETVGHLGETFRTRPADRSGTPPPYRARWATVHSHVGRPGPAQEAGVVQALCPVQVLGRHLLASAGNDGRVRLWDPRDGTEHVVLGRHDDTVHTLARLPRDGGDLLASVGADRSVRIWDTRTGAEIYREDHPFDVLTLCPLPGPDGGQVLIGGRRGEIRLLDPQTRATQHLTSPHLGTIRSLRAVDTPDGVTVASTDTDGTVFVRRHPDGDPVELEGHQGWVTVCWIVTPTGPWLVTAAGNGSVRMWDRHGRLRRPFPDIGGVTAACEITVDGAPLLATGVTTGLIRLWDPETAEPVRDLAGHHGGHRGRVTALSQVVVDGVVRLASAGADATLRLWDPATGDESSAIPTDVPNQIVGLTLLNPLPHRSRPPVVVTADRGNRLRLWDRRTGARRGLLAEHEDWVNAVCTFTLDGQELIASASDDRTVRIWDPSTGRPVTAPLEHIAEVPAVCTVPLPDGTVLASACRDWIVRLWDLRDPAPARARRVTQLVGHTGAVTALAVLAVPHGVRLASGSRDGTVRLWNPVTHETEGLLEGRWITALCGIPTPDGDLLAVADDAGRTRLWDPVRGVVRDVRTRHPGGIKALTAVPARGGSLLASVGADHVVRLHDPLTGECRTTVPLPEAGWSLTADDAGLVIGLESGLLAIELSR